jgi:predicted translin family RNA/ssDNA-binding protein
MRNEEVKQVYEIAREVVKENAASIMPVKEYDDATLKEEITKLKGEVTSLQGEIKTLKEPVNKKK